MRVLYVLPAEGFGGAERQGVIAMAHLPDAGVDVVPFVGPGEPVRRALADAGVADYFFCPELPRDVEGPGGPVRQAHRVLHIARAIRASAARIAQVARRERVDLIFASRSVGWAAASLARRRLGRLPLVWRAGSRTTSRAELAALALGDLVAAPDALVCNCEAVRESIAPSLGCPSVVLPNAIDLARFAPREPLRPEPPGRFVIGVAARPSPDKGFDLLAEALVRLAGTGLPVQLLVAGEFPWRPHYEALFQHHGLGSRVRFLGHVEDMPDFYARCDAVVLPSRARSIEGSSNALLEAMAMARPVVATRVGGTNELVAHGATGLLSSPGDATDLAAALESLARSPALRERLGKAARAHVQAHHETSQVMRQLAHVLRQVHRDARSFAPRSRRVLARLAAGIPLAATLAMERPRHTGVAKIVRAKATSRR